MNFTKTIKISALVLLMNAPTLFGQSTPIPSNTCCLYTAATANAPATIGGTCANHNSSSLVNQGTLLCDPNLPTSGQYVTTSNNNRAYFSCNATDQAGSISSNTFEYGNECTLTSLASGGGGILE